MMSGQQRGDDLVGVLLGGAYQVRERVGVGGMGSVYRADHLRLPKSFAIKVLNDTVDPASEPYRRFRREAEICSRLKHEHIVEVVDFNLTEGGRPYLVMEWLEGEDLGSRLERVGRLSPAQAARILKQVATALTEAHELGVVHRDLKPQNIFLCRRRHQDDYVKLVDFGISKVLGAESMLTGVNTVIGTPYYMSPEQAGAGTALVDHRTDVYAFGVIAYQMLVGTVPFDGENLAQIVVSILSSPAPSLCAGLPGLSPAVDAVVGRAIAKDPQARFQTVAELDLALGSALSSSVDSVAAGSPGEPKGGAAGGPGPPARFAAAPSSPDTALAGAPTTLSGATGQGASLAAPTSHRGRRTALLVALGGGAVLVGFVVVGLLGSSRSRRGRGAMPPLRPARTAHLESARGTPAPVQPSSSRRPREPGTRDVRRASPREVIRLLNLPTGAVCRVGGQIVHGDRLTLDRSGPAVMLVCASRGHRTFRRRVIPGQDTAVRVDMPLEPPAPGRVPRTAMSPRRRARPHVRVPARRWAHVPARRSVRPPGRAIYDDVPIE